MHRDQSIILGDTDVDATITSWESRCAPAAGQLAAPLSLSRACPRQWGRGVGGPAEPREVCGGGGGLGRGVARFALAPRTRARDTCTTVGASHVGLGPTVVPRTLVHRRQKLLDCVEERHPFAARQMVFNDHRNTNGGMKVLDRYGYVLSPALRALGPHVCVCVCVCVCTL